MRLQTVPDKQCFSSANRAYGHRQHSEAALMFHFTRPSQAAKIAACMVDQAMKCMDFSVLLRTLQKSTTPTMWSR
jgi:hypothetical protein